MVTAASAVGFGIVNLARSGASDAAAPGLARGGIDVAPLSASQPRNAWEQLPFSPRAPLIPGAIATILIGLVLRRRAVRRATEESPEFGYAGSPSAFEGLFSIPAEETRDGDSDSATWDVYIPPSP
jgi:hypothetical protein